MSDEAGFLQMLRAMADSDIARNFDDDVAVLDMGEDSLIFTKDVLVANVHYLPDDPPYSIGWKLVMVNMSDLAAKGAEPIGVLMGYSLSGDAQWDSEFLRGVAAALKITGGALIGGDTVRQPDGDGRVFSITAIGKAKTGHIPSRSGAQDGDALCVTGMIGDGWGGLDCLQNGRTGQDAEKLITHYRQPEAQIKFGKMLAPRVHAMMDISDGLLIDAGRMARASDIGMRIDLDDVFVSNAYESLYGDSREALLQAVTGGDDYVLLAAIPAKLAMMLMLSEIPVVIIGRCSDEFKGLRLTYGDTPMALPENLGWQHS